MTDQLHAIATIWAVASARSLQTLGTKVNSDGQFFDKISSNRTCTVATFEKFLTFFRDAANWPDNVIPQGAAELLENFENIASAADAEVVQCHGGDAVAFHGDTNTDSDSSASTGLSQEMSREVVA